MENMHNKGWPFLSALCVSAQGNVTYTKINHSGSHVYLRLSKQ